MSRMYSSIQILLCHHAIDFSNTFSVKTTDELRTKFNNDNSPCALLHQTRQYMTQITSSAVLIHIP